MVGVNVCLAPFPLHDWVRVQRSSFSYPPPPPPTPFRDLQKQPVGKGKSLLGLQWLPLPISA